MSIKNQFQYCMFVTQDTSCDSKEMIGLIKNALIGIPFA
jgi:hypothetical protein